MDFGDVLKVGIRFFDGWLWGEREWERGKEEGGEEGERGRDKLVLKVIATTLEEVICVGRKGIELVFYGYFRERCLVIGSVFGELKIRIWVLVLNVNIKI